ncbi:hypothetical protein [Geoglobus ahangari]
MPDDSLEEIKKGIEKIEREIKRINETITTSNKKMETISRTTNDQFFKLSISFTIILAGYSLIVSLLPLYAQKIIGLTFLLLGIFGIFWTFRKYNKENGISNRYKKSENKRKRLKKSENSFSGTEGKNRK